jgi:quercetin dioxygenase-like cupin family protein
LERKHDEAWVLDHPVAREGMMSKARTSFGHWRGVLLLLAALVALGAPVLAAANERGLDPSVELIVIFPVTDPPAAPYDAVQMMLDFEPGAAVALHHHGGSGYITVLHGALTLYADGVENVYNGGDSFIETPDVLYKGGNESDSPTRLMVTYLIPDGEEVTTVVDDPDEPEPPHHGPTPLAQATYRFADPPVEFDLAHLVHRIAPGDATGTRVAEGDIMVTAVEGTLTVTVDGAEQTVEAGSGIVVLDGQEFSLGNAGDDDVLTMSSEFGPLEISVFLPPATGSPNNGMNPVWLLALAAIGLFGVGAGLRWTMRRTLAA